MTTGKDRAKPTLLQSSPVIAAEWHPTLNGELKPDEVAPNSGKRAWWFCSKCSHEWEAIISNRNKGRGCPNCKRSQIGRIKSIPKAGRSLLDLHPNVAAEWHPTLNDDLKPDEVAIRSDKIVWWQGEKCGHQWKSSVSNRVAGNSCPYCAGQMIMTGFNDLATTHPELAAEWHPTLNGDLKPTQVSKGKHIQVWWRGEKCGHQWKSILYSRPSGIGCPFCAGKAVLEGFNDLATTHPEIAAEWHPTLNDDLKPTQVSKGSEKKFWWLGKECHHEWRSTVLSRTNGSGCIFCAGKAVLEGFNDLATTHPEIAAEWHPTLNDDLKPTQVSKGTPRKVWWLGKECHHEWIADVAHRVSGRDCPYCVGQAVLEGFNDLATTHPEIAAEWHPTLNGDLKPTQVRTSSNKKVWWQGTSCKHNWQSAVTSRTNGSGCIFCAGKAVLEGFNDLATTHPEIAAEWHPTLNGDLKPTQVSKGTPRKVWWLGRSCGHQWRANVGSRSSQTLGCAICHGLQIQIGVNDLKTTNPTLANEWHPVKNHDRTAEGVTAGSSSKAWWLCSDCSYEWQAAISSRNNGIGCPSCATYGFNPTLPSWLYFLEHLDWELLQIGITNFPEKRLGRHVGRGWVVIDLRGPMDGQLTRDLESAILAAVKSRGAQIASTLNIKKFDGWTESWSRETFSANSIKELLNLVYEDD